MSVRCAVKEKIKQAAKARGVKREPFVSCRVTQLYDTGACLYFYFGFVWDGLKVSACLLLLLRIPLPSQCSVTLLD